MPNKSSAHGGNFITGTISHGTLRPQELLRNFAAELNRLMPFNSVSLVVKAHDNADHLDGEPTNQDYADACEVLTELEDELNAIAAREGNYYFGTTGGDGSDFGFWENEEETE